MSTVTLVSGGLDSTLMAVLIDETGLSQYPLFINYGQRAAEKELRACKAALKRHGLPTPEVLDIREFGRLIRSGLTDPKLDVVEDAFTPGRNFMFVLLAAAYAMTTGASSVAIGLLNEETALFPDQTTKFLKDAERAIATSMGRPIKLLTPLRNFFKKDVVKLAELKGISSTYSCHTGLVKPCGQCIACREFQFEER